MRSPQKNHACHPDKVRRTIDGSSGYHLGCSDAHPVHVQCEYGVAAPDAHLVQRLVRFFSHRQPQFETMKNDLFKEERLELR